MPNKVLAFDFGASTGRALLGSIENNKLTYEEIHRFSNIPIMEDCTLYWDIDKLFYEIKIAITKVKDIDNIISLGIDTWGVDFGIIDKNNNLIEKPVHYRDTRTKNSIKEVSEIIDLHSLYKMTGNQIMPINTLFQIFYLTRYRKNLMEKIDKILLIPDLLVYMLTGIKCCNLTIASTTQMMRPYCKKWNEELLSILDIDCNILPDIVNSGVIVGKIKKDICNELNVKAIDVISVCEHDTASAFVSVPTQDKEFIHISCGTWSVFGVECDRPIITKKSMMYNITNELNFDGKTRFIKNIIGLYLIQELKKEFLTMGREYSFQYMEELASEVEAFKSFIDPDDERFLEVGNVIRKIREVCVSTNQYVPQSDGELIRCVYESLAMKYRFVYDQITECVNRKYSKIYISGGGSQSKLLCQMTANSIGIQVAAGPTEATAIGNMVVQFISKGKLKNIEHAKSIINNSFSTIVYEPSCDWSKGYHKFKNFLCKYT